MAYKEFFDEGYQKKVGKNSPLYLHENSIELVKILDNFGVITNNMHIFEIGSGGGRNLKYINDFNSTIKLSANDLHKNASFEEMDEKIKEKINFYEIDTLSLVNTSIPEKIDLLIASDHLMHIETEDVKVIMNVITEKWQPTYILLREIHPEGENLERRLPRVCHNFNFGNNYVTLAKINCSQSLYYIQLLQRK